MRERTAQVKVHGTEIPSGILNKVFTVKIDHDDDVDVSATSNRELRLAWAEAVGKGEDDYHYFGYLWGPGHPNSDMAGYTEVSPEEEEAVVVAVEAGDPVESIPEPTPVPVQEPTEPVATITIEVMDLTALNKVLEALTQGALLDDAGKVQGAIVTLH